MMFAQTSDLSQVIVIVVAGLLVVLIPFAVKAFRRLFADVHDLKVAVTGDEKYGIPGLTSTVEKLVRTAGLTQQGTAALIKDSKPDAGTTSRDVLDRIEANQNEATP